MNTKKTLQLLSFFELIFVTFLIGYLIYLSATPQHTLELTISIIGYIIYFALWRARFE